MFCRVKTAHRMRLAGQLTALLIVTVATTENAAGRSDPRFANQQDETNASTRQRDLTTEEALELSNAMFPSEIGTNPKADSRVPGQYETRGTTARQGPMTADDVRTLGKSLWDGMTPSEMGTRKPLHPLPKAPRVLNPSDSPYDDAVAIGATVVSGDNTVRNTDATQAGYARALEAENLRRSRDNVGTTLGAAIEQTWLLPAMKRAFDRQITADTDPRWADKWDNGGRAEAAKYAQTGDELDILLRPSSANSEADFLFNKKEVDTRRLNNEILRGSGSPVLWTLGVRIFDPIILLALSFLGLAANRLRTPKGVA